MNKFKVKLKSKNIEFSMKRYGIDCLSAMAQGLFSSLLIGTIINTLGILFNIHFLLKPVATIASINYTVGGMAMAMSGPAMAVAIGYSLKTPPLVLFSLTAVGFASNALGGAGGPIAVLLIAIISSEIGKLVSKETNIDILITPFITIGSGIFLSWLIAPSLGYGAMYLGKFIMLSTELNPFIMGILVSVLAGIALTLPISSAAICAALGLTGLAGGASLAGCCSQMIGFAVISFRDNGWGGSFSQGIGTSMLQMPNIIKNPYIWVAPTLASAITGPIATCIFKLRMDGPSINAGMGTCGLCGQIGVFQGWIDSISKGSMYSITPFNWIGLILISFIFPAIFSIFFDSIIRKLGLVKNGDMKI